MKQKIVHKGVLFTLKSKTSEGDEAYICGKCALAKGPLCGIAPMCDSNEYFKIVKVEDVT